jgi:menaquinone-dependent protoporphyrinogen oxidase
MKILILYATSEGQTGKIARHIADFLRTHGHQVVLQDGQQLPQDFSVDRFDAAIVGGSIHLGKYQPAVTKFVAEYRDCLNRIPSALFTVCMGVNSRHTKDREAAHRYSSDFIQHSGWQPGLSESFAGAVKYTHYNMVTRFVMKMISKREGGSTDTGHDHEYTDWAAVDRFAEQFVNTLSGSDTAEA